MPRFNGIPVEDEQRRPRFNGIPVEQERPEPSMLQRAWGAITGNAAEDLPSVYGSAFTKQNEKAGKSAFGAGMAATFGDDSDVANAILRDHPGAKLVADANGNPVIQMPDGQRFYVNQPGLDVADATRFGSKAMQFLPAGRLAGMIGGASLLGRAAVGGVAAGATDVGAQALAGRSEIDPAQVATTAAFGAGAELAAPVLQRGTEAARNLLTKEPTKIEIGRKLAAEAGIDDVTDDMAAAIFKKRNEIKAGATPESVIAENQFGFKLSKGQKLHDPEVMDYEDFLRNKDNGSPLDLLKGRNEAHMLQVNQQLRSQLARRPPVELEQDSATQIQEALRSAQEQGRRKVKRAYLASDKAGKGVYAPADDFSAIPSQIDKAFRGQIALSPELTPSALGARKILNEFVEDSGNAAVSIQRIEELRKRMNVYYRESAKREPDLRAMTAMMKEFDQRTGEAVARNMMEQGPEAVAAIQKARATASKMFRLFDASKPSGKRIMQAMADDASPEQVANFLLGANGLNQGFASSVAHRYLKIVGKDSEAANAMRDMVLRRIFAAKNTSVQSADVTVSQLNSALSGKGNSLMSALFSKEEVALLKNYQRALQGALLPPPRNLIRGSVGGSSGTAERDTRWAQYAIQRALNSNLGKFPIIGDMARAVISRGASNNALRGPRPIRNPLIPASGAAAGQSVEEDRRRRRP